MFDQIGFRPGKVNAIAAGLVEAGGGALLAAGLGTPIAGAAGAGTMIVASSMHTGSGFFSSNGGFELPAVLGAGAAALALTGPGALSRDHILGHQLNRNWMRTLALAAVVPAAFTSSPGGAASAPAHHPGRIPRPPRLSPTPTAGLRAAPDQGRSVIGPGFTRAAYAVDPGT
jgi:hypothetical protein